MKLTKDQLLEIKAFIEKRGFSYVDVQLDSRSFGFGSRGENE